MASPKLPVTVDLPRLQGFVSLQERMSRDLSGFGHERRREDDVQALARLGGVEMPEIEAPEAPITGTTGYEGMLRGGQAPGFSIPDESGTELPAQLGSASLRQVRQPAPTVGQPSIQIQPEPQSVAEEPQSFGMPSEPGPEMGSQTLSAGSQGAPGAGAGSGAAAGDIAGYIRQAAAARGIDPDTAVRVAMSEGGVTDPVRQSDVVNAGRRETSYGPFQLYVGGGLGDAALARGIDPRDPAQWRQGIDFALDEAARSGWGPWHGAARVGIGTRQGLEQARPIGISRGDSTQAASEAVAASGPQGRAAGPAYGTYTAETLTPSTVNQWTQGQAEGLTTAETLAVCGPAAAIAFARANGRNPTLREAKELGSRLGVWNVSQGMAGPASQVRLLDAMGVPSTLHEGADEAAIAAEVQAGRPVIIDSPGHYYVAVGYDPQTRQFDLGESAKVLKASGGRSRFRLEELPSLGMGAARATIFMRSR